LANDTQFKTSTVLVATRGVKEYRETIPSWVDSADEVLEIGCEFGTTSTLLVEHCTRLLATDLSAECVARARTRHPHVQFDVLDVYDVPKAMRSGPFTKVYMDVSGFSGYRSLLDLIAILQMYATMLEPRAIVVKSGALKHFLSHGVVWRGRPA
jgi:trans-aconitate methyltransferase